MGRGAGGQRAEASETADSFELMDHVGLVLSLAGGGYVLVSVLGLAEFDLTTALGIVESVGPVGLLLRGFVITALPLLMMFGFVAAMLAPRPQWWFAHHPKAFGSFLGLGLLLFGAIPSWLALGSIPFVVTGVVGVVRSGGGAEPSSSSWRKEVAVAAFVAFSIAFVAAFLPWLPSQAITHAETGRFTGYVLQSSDGLTTVLADHPRRILRLDSAATSYEICAPPQDVLWRTSALQLLPAFGDQAEYPSCPTSAPRIPATPQPAAR